MAEINKTKAPSKFLWVDLEMTGLEPEQDVIIEVAALITDVNFKTLARYEAIVQQPHEVVVDRINKNVWWQDYPENRDEFITKTATGKPSQQVEQELVTLTKEHFGDESAVLAGNSIHNDRNFIKQWWPQLDSVLHYRMLDVSAFKVLLQTRGVEFEKQGLHRALDDIEASIAELAFYMEWFKTHDA